MHPFILAICLIMVGGFVYGLSASSPWLAPVLLAASVSALALRAAQLAAARRRAEAPSGAIDFEALRAREITPYLGWLKENVRGHDDAVERVVERIQRNLRLAGERRTLGSFLLVGPTGTGKTFLAELAAQALHPHSEPVVLRMNQYKDHGDVFTLIGPPPGHPGYEVGGALTRPVLENPYRVVILDEFEKCHPDVQHCLYDILDSAQCREKSSGRVVTFGACALFATCNAAAASLRAIAAAAPDEHARLGRFREALSREAGFEKSLLARFDEILLMDELKPLHMAEVACLQIAKHWRQHGIEVTYASPEILMEAIRRNVEFSEYGVRQLARLVQAMTDSSIEGARRNGARCVRLDFDRATGRITVA